MKAEARRTLTLLGEALELEPVGRARFLDDVDAEDAALGKALRELLLEHESTGSILDDESFLIPFLGSEAIELPSPIEPGTLLAGRFEVVRCLGAGGMGVTYAAWDRVLETDVALKVVTQRDDADLEARFRREIQLSRHVTHPNVCRVFDLFSHEHDGRTILFLTMELIEGVTLAAWRRNREPVARSEILDIAEPIAAALDAAHRAGIIHRDLKPSNVMIETRSDPNRVVVLDFGLAKSLDPETRKDPFVTGDGKIFGTPGYMAPEQLAGGEASAASDVYSFGLLLYELTTGGLPFGSDPPVAGALRRLREDPPSPRRIRPDLPREWSNAIRRCLEREPARRFTSAGEAIQAMRSRGSRRRAWLAAAIAGLVIAVAALVPLLRNEQRPRGPASSVAARESPAEPVHWIVMTEFENRTGDELLDGTLEFALARELERTGTVAIASRERVADALRLMRRGDLTRIDRSVGREVALRDGGIETVIDGRIAKIGSTYLVRIELLDPRSGETVHAYDTEASSLDEILPAIRKLGERILRRLTPGKAPVEPRLADVTTASLRALQLYTAADRSRDIEQGEELFRQAIAEDPEFASGTIRLAYAIKNRGGTPAEYLPLVSRAVELSEKANERERLFIRASAFRLQGDFENATKVYRALLSRYPDDVWSVNNMCSLLAHYTPDHEKAVPYHIKRAELRPNDFNSAATAAMALSVWAGDWIAARRWVDRAQRLRETTPRESRDVWLDVWIEMVPIHEAWIAGDVEALDRRIKQFHETIQRSSGRRRTVQSEALANLELTRGRVDVARALYATLPEQEQPAWDLLLATTTDEPETLHDRTRALSSNPTGTDIIWLIAQSIRLGDLESARTLLARENEQLENIHFDDRNRRSAELRALEGMLLHRSGRSGEAIPILQDSVRSFAPTARFLYFLTASELALAHLANQDRESAKAILESAVARKKGALSGTAKLYWMEIALELAALHRNSGETEAAARIEGELHALTLGADPRFFVARRLARLTE